MSTFEFDGEEASFDDSVGSVVFSFPSSWLGSALGTVS